MKRMFTRVVIAVLFVSISILPVYAVNVSNPGTNETLPDAATINKAVTEFNSLSKKEKREKIKLVKKTLKDYKAAKKRGAEPTTNTLLLAILAILLPPLAVYLHEGTINTKFWISLVLSILFWLPGVIYALIVVLS